jgi:hypothetical protein
VSRLRSLDSLSSDRSRASVQPRHGHPPRGRCARTPSFRRINSADEIRCSCASSSSARQTSLGSATERDGITSPCRVGRPRRRSRPAFRISSTTSRTVFGSNWLRLVTRHLHSFPLLGPSEHAVGCRIRELKNLKCAYVWESRPRGGGKASSWPCWAAAPPLCRRLHGVPRLPGLGRCGEFPPRPGNGTDGGRVARGLLAVELEATLRVLASPDAAVPPAVRIPRATAARL